MPKDMTEFLEYLNLWKAWQLGESWVYETVNYRRLLQLEEKYNPKKETENA
jgi:hypothetical protein